MKKFSITPIREFEILENRALEFIKGGALGVYCTINNCGINYAGCGKNNCNLNDGGCDENGCTSNCAKYVKPCDTKIISGNDPYNPCKIY